MNGSPDDPRIARRQAVAERRRRVRRRNGAILGGLVLFVGAAGAGWALRTASWDTAAQASSSAVGESPAMGVQEAAPATVTTARVRVTATAAPADDHARDRGLVVASTPARPRVTVPVLMYHRVAAASTATNAVSRDLTVTPRMFRDQMDWLKRNGYTAVSQATVFRAMEQGTRLPRKPVVITFDDGYVDAVDSVLPVLAADRWPATFFIITSRIGARAFLTWPQLKRLDAAGMDVGSHTVGHTELPSQASASRRTELVSSRATLEKGLGHPVRWFCYPAGRYDDVSVAAVKDAGYLLAYTTQPGSVLNADARAALPRVRVRGQGSLDEFAQSMRAASSS